MFPFLHFVVLGFLYTLLVSFSICAKPFERSLSCRQCAQSSRCEFDLAEIICADLVVTVSCAGEITFAFGHAGNGEDCII